MPGLTFPLGSRMPEDLTPIKLKAVEDRAPAQIYWDRPATYLIMGNRNTGKSALIESFAERHRRIIDLYGSKDNENLCWCRKKSPIDDVLLIHGDNTEVDAPFDTKKIGSVNLSDLENYEATVTCNSFFSSDKNKFDALEKMMDVLYQRSSWQEGKIMFMAFRETMDLIYSKMSKGEGEKAAKAEILYFLRQLRHFGVSAGADMLRWTGIDKEMRDLSEYIIFKKAGWKGLPGDLGFVYKYVNPLAFRYMKNNQFVLLQENGNLAMGRFGLPKYHKEEGVDLLKETGITVEHSEEPEESSSQKVGDKEHENMVLLYNENQSMRIVKEKMSAAGFPDRSISTISFQIAEHNKSVAASGYCPKCMRSNKLSDLVTEEIYTR